MGKTDFYLKGRCCNIGEELFDLFIRDRLNDKIHREFPDQGQELKLICRQNIFEHDSLGNFVHAVENIYERNRPSGGGNYFACPMSAC